MTEVKQQPKEGNVLVQHTDSVFWPDSRVFYFGKSNFLRLHLKESREGFCRR